MGWCIASGGDEGGGSSDNEGAAGGKAGYSEREQGGKERGLRPCLSRLQTYTLYRIVTRVAVYMITLFTLSVCERLFTLRRFTARNTAAN